MHTYTRMGLSFDRISLEGLKNLNKTWCKHHNTMASAAPPPAQDMMMERAMVFTVVLMALLGCTLFGAGFMRLFVGRHTLHLRLLLGGYNLYPIMRILLHSTLVLFLPLLSYMFSHTQSQAREKKDSDQIKGLERELLLMIMWMLLIELIRRKVHVMMLPADGSSFSRGIGRFTPMDYSDDATRLLWVGYLIYSNRNYIFESEHDATSLLLVAMFIILWSLSLVKLVHTGVNTWLASRSWLTARNPLLIAAYMQHVLDDEEEVNHSSAAASAAIDMTNCKYAVMGEEILVPDKEKRRTREEEPLKIATTHGYGYGVGKRVPYGDQNEQKHVHLLIDPKLFSDKRLVTVGDIWKLPNKHPNLFSSKRRQQYLEDLCLSFSLFKMLRRRFEHYPMVEVGSVMARKLMLEGLLTLELEGDNPKDKAHRPFQVLHLELDFLENYYQDAAPVVMSQPILFFSNFALSLLFVLIYIAAVLAILINTNDAAHLYCIAMGWASGDLRNFPWLYPSITMSLVVTLIAIEATEFCTLYFFSNWNIVRQICSYEQCGVLRRPIYYCLISASYWASRVVRRLAKFFLRRQHTDIKINQVSIVNACGLFDKFSARASQVALAPEAKADIVESLKSIDLNTGCISLPHMSGLNSCGKTSTEIIMAFHLATELFEIVHDVKCQKNLQDDPIPKAVATALSRYCMYLVAHTPDLLPDDETWVCDRYEDMRSCLEHVSEQCCCTMYTPSHRCRKTLVDNIRSKDYRDGVKLFGELIKQLVEAGRSEAHVWKDLAEFWVQLLIYLAPSNDVQGHAKALASSGGDLINYLWAFCTHAGITRQPLEQHTAGDQNA